MPQPVGCGRRQVVRGNAGVARSLHDRRGTDVRRQHELGEHGVHRVDQCFVDGDGSRTLTLEVLDGVGLAVVLSVRGDVPSKTDRGSILARRAARYTNGLNADPVWRRPWVATSNVRAASPPNNARTAPSPGTIETTAAVGSPEFAEPFGEPRLRRHRTLSGRTSFPCVSPPATTCFARDSGVPPRASRLAASRSHEFHEVRRFEHAGGRGLAGRVQPERLSPRGTALPSQPAAAAHVGQHDVAPSRGQSGVRARVAGSGPADPPISSAAWAGVSVAGSTPNVLLGRGADSVGAGPEVHLVQVALE